MNPVQKIAIFDCDNTASLFSHSLTRIKATCSSEERKDLLGIALGWCGTFKRLCVALSAFNNPSQPIIDERIVQWVANWIVFHLEKLLSRLEINGLDEEVGVEEDVLNIVYDFGKKGASSRDIGQKLRAFRNMDAVQKLEMLTKLQAQEKIIEKKEGKAVRYFMPVFFKSNCATESK